MDKHGLSFFLERELKDITDRFEEVRKGTLLFYRLGEREEDFLRLLSYGKKVTEKNFFLVLQVSAERSLSLEVKELRGVFPSFVIFEKEEFVRCQQKILDDLYPLHKKKIKLIGITGTNGKTTSAHLTAQLCNLIDSKKKTFYLGTLGLIGSSGKIERALSNTTPGPIELRKIFHHYFVKKNYHAGVMEVSSHALHQRRIEGYEFDVVGITNFTQDHLDYHPSMEEYFQSKMILFKEFAKKMAAFIVPKSQENLSHQMIKAGLDEKRIRMSSLDCEREKLPSFLQVSFNEDNIAFSFSLVESLFKINLTKEKRENLASKLKNIPGRFQVISLAPFSSQSCALIDSAHTPDAMEKIITATKEVYPHHLIWTLFGCGGNRDASKRPLMGKMAASLSDKIFLTSDNVRDEDPQQIIYDVKKGIPPSFFTPKNYREILLRQEAIEEALREIKESEEENQKSIILLLLGKGHEDYEIIGEEKRAFLEEEIILRFIARKEKKLKLQS